MGRTRTQQERTETEPTAGFTENRTKPEPQISWFVIVSLLPFWYACFANKLSLSLSVCLSLTVIIGAFTHVTVNEEVYIT